MGSSCSRGESGEKWYGPDGPGVEYGTHNHGGLMARVIHKDEHHPLNERDCHTVFELNMTGVEEAFGDKWQCNYDEEHKKIFAANFEGKTIRAGMRAEHDYMYSVSCGGTDTGVLLNAGQFLDLLEHGWRDGRRRVFTYALMDDGWYFSETGANMVADIVSKHAVHAYARPAVRMAGTFRIIEHPDNGESAILLDNDSGTYRPSSQQFDNLKRAMHTNFPKLNVIALDCCAAQPEEYKKWYGPNEVKTNEDCVYPGKWVWQNDDEE